MYVIFFFFLLAGSHRDLHVLTHSFPTRRSSDLPFGVLTHTLELGEMLGAVPEPLDPGGLVILAAVENARDDHASAEIQRTALQPESFEAVVDIRPFQPAQSAGLEDRKSTRLNSSH